MKMKKRIGIILSITIMTLTLAGCNNRGEGNDIQKAENNPPIEQEGESNADESGATPKEDVSDDSDRLLPGFEAWEDSEAIRALNRVLSLQETITDASLTDASISTSAPKVYYLNELDTFLDYQFDTMLIPDQYAVVDLDQDGTPEVIVCLSSGNDGWIKVLRYYEGTVYGYSFVFRGFESPKIDGTYIASSGAMDNAIMRLSFDGIIGKENCLGYTASSGDGIMYYIGDEKVTEQEYSTFEEGFNSTQDVTWQLFQSNIRAGYEGQKLLRVDFKAKTHAQVQDLEEYYSGMEDRRLFSHSSLIPQELCELILDSMEHGTEEETFAPLMVDTEISQEEFCSETGIELGMSESVFPVRVDADNDGIEDLIGQYYWGGTGGFSSMELYTGSTDSHYTLTSNLDCFIQDYGFLQYQGKQYLLMKEFDYNTKYDSGYTLYLYENGILADGKVFSFVIDDYDMDMVYEDAAFADIASVKETLSNKKIPDILLSSDGVINGTAETIYRNDSSDYEYSSDIDNDGNQEYYNKSMWYPSNMGTVMSCMYTFEDSMILDDLCNRLSEEMGDGRLYTFWLDEVNGKNLLYLYYGTNLDYSLYAFLIDGK